MKLEYHFMIPFFHTCTDRIAMLFENRFMFIESVHTRFTYFSRNLQETSKTNLKIFFLVIMRYQVQQYTQILYAYSFSINNFFCHLLATCLFRLYRERMTFMISIAAIMSSMHKSIKFFSFSYILYCKCLCESTDT